MQLGDKVTARPMTLQGVVDIVDNQNRHTHTLHPGTVVYIHPERRYYVVEFRFDFGSFRETFYFYPRGGRD